MRSPCPTPKSTSSGRHRHAPRAFALAACVALGACDDAATATSDTSRDTLGATDAADTSAADTNDAADTTGTASSCTLAANTTATATVSPSGCTLVERDTTSCRAAREAAGLTGPWLSMSCRVTLEVTTANGKDVVRATADAQPDYPSMYFKKTDPCYEAWPEGSPNPNVLVATSRAIDFPRTPDTTSTAMDGGIVGIAVNGVPIFGNFAAPNDDIFVEAETFDRCGAHPAPGGTYHYHGEPLAISSDDARLIGVLRDGYPVYGRRDADGTMPTLDAQGGHTGPTADSATPVYHYHLNAQTSTSGRLIGQTQWFLTTGTYRGSPATCAACR